MTSASVSDVVIRRLPLYLRSLVQLQARGQQVVSSQELGRWLGISPAQIRKDLSYFGEFGRQGLGYPVAHLVEQLRSIVHADRDWQVAIVGAGALGRALVNYPGFAEWGFHIVAIFDNDPAKFGQRMRNLVVRPVSDMPDVVCTERIELGVVAVPPEAAQVVAEGLVACGVRALLNYAPIRLVLAPEVRVTEIDPVALLQSMTYYL